MTERGMTDDEVRDLAEELVGTGAAIGECMRDDMTMDDMTVGDCEAFDAIAGVDVDRYVSADAALLLARGVRSWPADVGIGVTAKLTTGPGERKDREHILFAAAVATRTVRVLSFSARLYSVSRAEQEIESAGHIQSFLLEAVQQFTGDRRRNQ